MGITIDDLITELEEVVKYIENELGDEILTEILKESGNKPINFNAKLQQYLKEKQAKEEEKRKEQEAFLKEKEKKGEPPKKKKSFPIFEKISSLFNKESDPKLLTKTTKKGLLVELMGLDENDDFELTDEEINAVIDTAIQLIKQKFPNTFV